MADESPTLYQRMMAVMKDVAYVQKDATVRAGGGASYKGVTHDAVIAALRPSLIRNGILVYTHQTNESAVEGTTKSGYPKIRYEGWYQVVLQNVDDANDRLVLPIHAHAEDGGDKAPGKCISYSTKTALLKAFSLETGESDESRYRPEDQGDPGDDQRAAPSRKKAAAKKTASKKKASAKKAASSLPRVDDEQVTELQDLIKQSGADKAALLDYYQITDLGALPAALFDELKGILDRKIANKG